MTPPGPGQAVGKRDACRTSRWRRVLYSPIVQGCTARICLISLALQSAPQRAAERHRPLIVVFAALVLVAALYWPTSVEIAGLWEDTTRRRYTHGWLILAVVVWLVWRDRAQLRSLVLAPLAAGWCVVAVGSIAWLVGLNAGLLAMTTLIMPLLVLVTIWAIAGHALTFRVAFAVLYLYFALPVWELINPALQSMTASVNLLLTRAAGIPVAMDGNFIQIPEGTFEIAGGCSGLHFFIVALAIAALQGELDRASLRSRWILLAIAAVLALVTNWLRVFIVIVAGHLTGMQHFLVQVDHYYFGWFVFVFALAGYFLLASRVPRHGREQAPAPGAVAESSRSRNVVVTLASVGALALGPAWSYAGSRPSLQHDLAPPSLPGWTGPGLWLSDWRPVFANADEEYLVGYHRDSAVEVGLYRAVYRSQRQGKEVRGYGNSVLGQSYQAMNSGHRDLVLNGYALALSEHLGRTADGRDLVVWFLFTLDGRPDDMGLASQLVYGMRSLWRWPVAGVVALAAECRSSCDEARRDLEAAAMQALPAMLETPGAMLTDSGK